jgi:hypothetical protein
VPEDWAEAIAGKLNTKAVETRNVALRMIILFPLFVRTFGTFNLRIAAFLKCG